MFAVAVATVRRGVGKAVSLMAARDRVDACGWLLRRPALLPSARGPTPRAGASSRGVDELFFCRSHHARAARSLWLVARQVAQMAWLARRARPGRRARAIFSRSRVPCSPCLLKRCGGHLCMAQKLPWLQWTLCRPRWGAVKGLRTFLVVVCGSGVLDVSLLTTSLR